MHYGGKNRDAPNVPRACRWAAASDFFVERGLKLGVRAVRPFRDELGEIVWRFGFGDPKRPSHPLCYRVEAGPVTTDSVPAAEPPTFAAWEHRETRGGFEVAFISRQDRGYRIDGTTAAVEAGDPWSVDYVIVVDGDWATVTADVRGRAASGSSSVSLRRDATRRWSVNGAPAPHLDGCADVDLESSALTNALPVHRLTMLIGDEAPAPAAYVRAAGLGVERLEQRYVRLDDHGGCERSATRPPPSSSNAICTTTRAACSSTIRASRAAPHERSASHRRDACPLTGRPP